jgi:hypothetical protein
VGAAIAGPALSVIASEFQKLLIANVRRTRANDGDVTLRRRSYGSEFYDRVYPSL